MLRLTTAGMHVRDLTGPATLGRSECCSIRLLCDKVSRRHCLISPEGDSWYLADLSSMNGTYLNDRRVEEPSPLNHGDVIRIGYCEFRVSLCW